MTYSCQIYPPHLPVKYFPYNVQKYMLQLPGFSVININLFYNIVLILLHLMINSKSSTSPAFINAVDNMSGVSFSNINLSSRESTQFLRFSGILITPGTIQFLRYSAPICSLIQSVISCRKLITILHEFLSRYILSYADSHPERLQDHLFQTYRYCDQ